MAFKWLIIIPFGKLEHGKSHLDQCPHHNCGYDRIDFIFLRQLCTYVNEMLMLGSPLSETKLSAALNWVSGASEGSSAV